MLSTQNNHDSRFSVADNKMNIGFKRLLASAILLLATASHAGSVEDGPFVVWMNLAQDTARVDADIRAHLNSGKAPCWPDTGVLFMRIKPKAITPDLARRALVKRDQAAIRQLNALLKQRFGEAYDGFDGIVAYHDRPAAVMYSLTTGSRKVERLEIDLNTAPDSVQRSFCSVVPEIARSP